MHPHPTIRALAYAASRVAGIEPSTGFLARRPTGRPHKNKSVLFARMIFCVMALRYTGRSRHEVVQVLGSRRQATAREAVSRWGKFSDRDEVLPGLTKRHAEQLFLVEMLRYDQMGPDRRTGGELLLIHSQQRKGQRPTDSQVAYGGEGGFWI